MPFIRLINSGKGKTQGHRSAGTRDEFQVRMANERFEQNLEPKRQYLHKKANKRRVDADLEIEEAKEDAKEFYKMILQNRQNVGLWEQVVDSRQRFTKENLEQMSRPSSLPTPKTEKNSVVPKSPKSPQWNRDKEVKKSPKSQRRSQSAKSRPKEINLQHEMYSQRNQQMGVSKNSFTLIRASSSVNKKADKFTRSYAELKNRVGHSRPMTATETTQSITGIQSITYPSFHAFISPQERKKLEMLHILNDHQKKLQKLVRSFCKSIDHSCNPSNMFVNEAEIGKSYLPLRRLSWLRADPIQLLSTD